MVQWGVTLGGWTFHDQSRDNAFVAVASLCRWYAIVRSRSTSETDLVNMQKYGVALRQSLRDSVSANGLQYVSKAVKHHILLHYPDLVRRFGAMLYQSCEMWDSAHKYMIKSHLVTHGARGFQRLVEQRVAFAHFVPHAYGTVKQKFFIEIF